MRRAAGLARRRSTTPARSCWSGREARRSTRQLARPGHAVGVRQRARRHRRGDGSGAGAQQLLVEHQGAARLLVRALRRAGADGRAGRAHPGPPRRDARLGGRRDARATPSRATCSSSTTRTPAARTCPTSRWSRPVAVDEEIIGYTVSRAHHSDVGGMTPGSMPSESRSIFQEGIVIPPIRLVRRGDLVEDVLELVLANVRTPDIRRVDLLRAGCRERRRRRAAARARRAPRARTSCASAFDEVHRLRRASHARGPARRCRTARTRAAGRDRGGRRRRRRHSDPRRRHDRRRLDASSTSPARPVPSPGNVNCPRSVARSACLFALRVLLPADVPINAGTLRAARACACPEPLARRRAAPGAVVAGNVETSQRIADVVLAALGAGRRPAGRRAGHDEQRRSSAAPTGPTTRRSAEARERAAPGRARPAFTSGMSNTLNTPIEALELEFPLRVERYQLRYGTGGAGVHRGGDGIERRVRVLEPATLSLLTDRRRHAPAGQGRRLGRRLRREPRSTASRCRRSTRPRFDPGRRCPS